MTKEKRTIRIKLWPTVCTRQERKSRIGRMKQKNKSLLNE